MRSLTRMLAKFAACGRYRPRVLTLLVLALITATIVLSNLTFDLEYMGNFSRRSYGWPLIWRRCVLVQHPGWRTVGWYNSPPRLAGNAAVWLALAAVPTALCEWLLRRYRPRPRWNLRTMLAAVGLLAAFFACFANARDRANRQDPVIADPPKYFPMESASPLTVKRWGPDWLDLLGIDRFRRRIVSASITLGMPGNDKQEKMLLKQLSQLAELQDLTISVDQLTPDLCKALAELTQLRALSILPEEYYDSDELSIDERTSRDLLEAVRKLTRLESLYLTMELDSESVQSLAGLTNLRSLCLQDTARSGGGAERAALLGRLPQWLRLEALGIHSPRFGDGDLGRLAALARLKSLDIQYTSVTTAGLAELASLESLEELAIDGKAATGAGYKSLLEVKQLKTLHIGHPRRVPVVKALQQAKPELVIDDGSIGALKSRIEIERQWPIPYDAMPVRDFTWRPTSGAPWLTAAARADFIKSGGFASFDTAEWRDKEGRKLETPPGWGGGTVF